MQGSSLTAHCGAQFFFRFSGICPFSGLGPFSGLCAFLQGYPLSISWGSIPSSFFPFTFSILIISLQDFCIGGLLRPAGCFWPQGVSFGHTCHRPKSTTQVATLLCQKNISRYQKKNQACGWRSSICTGACSGRAGSLLMLPAFSTGLACKEEIKKAKWQQKLDTHLV